MTQEKIKTCQNRRDKTGTMNDQHKPTLTPVFNRLSLADRTTLRVAVARIAREDTLRNRAFFIPYAIPIGFSLLPLPMIPGSNIVPLGLTAAFIGGWAKMGLTKSARANKEELKRDFAHAAIIAAYRDMIVADSARPDHYRVKSFSVGAQMAKTVWRETVTATRHFLGIS